MVSNLFNFIVYRYSWLIRDRAYCVVFRLSISLFRCYFKWKCFDYLCRTVFKFSWDEIFAVLLHKCSHRKPKSISFRTSQWTAY